MLTVRWIRKDIGYEEVFEARRVWFRSQEVVGYSGNKVDIKQVVGMELMNGDTTTLDAGSFFVMNESGKTVADYHLGRKAFTESEANPPK